MSTEYFLPENRCEAVAMTFYAGPALGQAFRAYRPLRGAAVLVDPAGHRRAVAELKAMDGQGRREG